MYSEPPVTVGSVGPHCFIHMPPVSLTTFRWHDCHQETSGDVLQPPSGCPFTIPFGPLEARGSVTGYSAQLLTIRDPWPGPYSDRQTEGLQAKSDDLYFLKALPGLPSEHSQGHYSSWWAASVLLPQLRA